MSFVYYGEHRLDSYERYCFGTGSPHVAVTAGIHGDEQTSVYVANRLISFLQSAKLKGRVDIYPNCNPTAFYNRTRVSPFDNLDLNRSFCQQKSGTHSINLANSIWEETKEASYLLDLHCCGQYGSLYVMSQYSKYSHQKELATALGIPHVIHSSEAAGQLFVHTNADGRQALLIEMPGGQPHGVVNLEIGETVFQASLRFLNYCGALDCPTEPAMVTQYYGKIQRAKAENDGLFLPIVKPGSEHRSGTVIGTLDNVEQLLPFDALVLAVSPPGYIFKGERLFTASPPAITEDLSNEVT